MKIGVVAPTFPPIENVIRVVRRVEEKGYDSVWWPDHLMGWYPQSIWETSVTGLAAFQESPHIFLEPTTTISFASSFTQRIHLGIAVTDVIRRNPATLAQTAVTLTHISRGRFILGLGAGEAENVVPYGLTYEKIVSRLEEALKIIRLLWEPREKKKINFKGRFWMLKDAVFDLKPYRNTYPPIWIGGQGEKMLKLTGESGDGWIPVDLTVEEYREKLKIILESARKAGRRKSDVEKSLFASVVIDESRKECSRIMNSPLIKARALIYPSRVYEKHGYEHPLGKNFYGLTDYIPSKLTRKEALKAIEAVPKEIIEERYLHGSPNDVVEKLCEYEKIGVQHVVLWNETYFGDYGKVKSSYHCIDKVLNYFK